jgi:hypothetical protein
MISAKKYFFLQYFFFLLLILLMLGCGRRNTFFGVGIGIRIEPPKGVQKTMNLMSWYTSSSTSSTTMDKEEFLETAQVNRFIKDNNNVLFEELSQGKGEHIELLIKVVNLYQPVSLKEIRSQLSQQILDENNFLNFLDKYHSI